MCILTIINVIKIAREMDMDENIGQIAQLDTKALTNKNKKILTTKKKPIYNRIV
jgi:hypothetical protein